MKVSAKMINSGVDYLQLVELKRLYVLPTYIHTVPHSGSQTIQQSMAKRLWIGSWKNQKILQIIGIAHYMMR
jgi:hypothetical protein